MVDTDCVMVVGETCVRGCMLLLFLSDVFMESLCSYVTTNWYGRLVLNYIQCFMGLFICIYNAASMKGMYGKHGLFGWGIKTSVLAKQSDGSK